jgi:FAD/FMN-containing dehydrogenase
VVIDSSSLNAVRIVKTGTGGTAEIGAGSKWHSVLMAANAEKLTVPVIADTFLSVGGTISTGGFGVTTYDLGLQGAHTHSLAYECRGFGRSRREQRSRECELK